MSTKISEVVARIQRRVDSGTTQDGNVVAQKLGEAIDEVIGEFAPLFPSFLRAEIPFFLTPDTREYTIDNLFGTTALLRIVSYDGHFLARTDQASILALDPQGTTRGEPKFFAQVGASATGGERIWLNPVPDAVNLYYAHGYTRPTIPEVVSDDPIALPDDVVRAAEQGAVAMFKDERGDVDAEIALARFEKLKAQVVARHLPDEFRYTEIQNSLASSSARRYDKGFSPY